MTSQPIRLFVPSTRKKKYILVVLQVFLSKGLRGYDLSSAQRYRCWLLTSLPLHHFSLPPLTTSAPFLLTPLLFCSFFKKFKINCVPQISYFVKCMAYLVVTECRSLNACNTRVIIIITVCNVRACNVYVFNRVETIRPFPF